ncbi:ACT domain protein [Candidatus Bilamarchaeum dharawalense]|uniref:ACT domain protein n=1 Tax=Candidatus Bilamarchaeum dharawalense TaxID=2885759 RepID=A0A5E4LLN2_9ARCH|nr:ACT domain protein [Candidatus Bilamarchaeum dharawalense]
MRKVSELVWLYVKRRPFLKEIIRDGAVNFSALARKISIDAFGNKKNQNAVKMALIRMNSRLAKVEDSLEDKINYLLKKSSMVIKNKVVVVIGKKEIDGLKPLSYARSGRHVTYILEQKDFENIPKKLIWKSEENLNLITIESPETLEEVPGVISHILSALASEGINVVELISCYTDTILVVKQADTARAYQILSELTA